MPRLFNATRQHTLAVAAADPLTIRFHPFAHTSLLNYGPGAIWVAWGAGSPPAIADENSLQLASGTGFEKGEEASGTLQLLAEAATTVGLVIG